MHSFPTFSRPVKMSKISRIPGLSRNFQEAREVALFFNSGQTQMHIKTQTKRKQNVVTYKRILRFKLQIFSNKVDHRRYFLGPLNGPFPLLHNRGITGRF